MRYENAQAGTLVCQIEQTLARFIVGIVVGLVLPLGRAHSLGPISGMLWGRTKESGAAAPGR
jgi:hypothetical protein